MSALTAVWQVQGVLPRGKESEKEAASAKNIPKDLCCEVACRMERKKNHTEGTVRGVSAT